MEQMISQFEKAVELIANSESIYRNIARMSKRMYDNLISAGFTEEQAMQILMFTMNRKW